MIYLIIAFLSFLITIVSTPYLISYLIKKDIVDRPNGEERRIHTEPMPRMGGIIIFAVVLIITFAFYQDIFSKKYFIAGAILAFTLGLVDDIRGLSWQIKFVVQSFIAILLIKSLEANHFYIIKFIGITLPPILDYVVLFILIVGLLNSFNLMDGLDGLVSGYTLIIASMCFMLSTGSPFTFRLFLSSAIIGTTLGFLKFNANPARIFLGDSGSLTLGYFISALVIIISGEVSASTSEITQGMSRSVDLGFIIITLAVPIADTLRVMFVRIKQRKNPFLPDSNHLHHILYSQKLRHKTVVMLIHLFSIMFVLLAIYYAKVSKTTAFIIFILMLTAFFSVKQIVEFIIRKENLLAYGKLYKKIPEMIPKIYKNILMPLVALMLLILFVFLVFYEINRSQKLYAYFLLFLIPSLLYSGSNLRKNNYYAELLVLINIIVFFIITGFNGFFYKLYPVPIIAQININQIFIITLAGMIIFFVLFKERIANIRQQFLTGTDLTIAVLILFIYLAVQIINLPESYKVSDTLLRSFLVFLFYKIVIATMPRFHFSLYYSSFIISVIAILKSLF